MTVKPFFAVLSVLVILLATALVVALGLELRRTRADFSDFAARSRLLQPGAYAPTLPLRLLGDEPVVLGSNDSGQCEVLFLYNTTCEFCRASIPIWNEIARRASADTSVEVYGVSLDSLSLTRTYAASHELTYPTALLLDDRSRSLLRASAVPQTLLITAAGRVLFSRPGVPTAGAIDSLWTLIDGSVGAPRLGCNGRVATG